MYKVLDLDQNADYNEIKKAYFELAKKHHPDIDQSEGASIRFSAIQNAYETLSNVSKRAIYDATGNFADIDLAKTKPKTDSEVFRPPEGIKWYKRYKHPQTYYELMKAQGNDKNIQFDIKIDLDISFLELITGFTKVVKFLREEI